MRPNYRRKRYEATQRPYPIIYSVVLGTIAVIVTVWIGSVVFETASYSMNIYTEGISIAVTVFIINRVSRIRELQQLRVRLYREAKSRSNDIAIRAVERMKYENWLLGDDSFLQRVDLTYANLQGADLKQANLCGSGLNDSELENADLTNANLEEVWFMIANMKSAQLSNANLTGAILIGADLQGANLTGAYMKGAMLGGSKLEETTFTGTTLPDGSEYLEGMDLSKFTSPAHPDYYSILDEIEEIRESMGMTILSTLFRSAFEELSNDLQEAAPLHQ